MSATHCLNCNAPLQGAYCHACGQKGSTHRLSLKHFLLHDLVHGLWHLDGAFPTTLRRILLTPGRSAIAYIGGKRSGHFNLITLMLILIATNVFVTRGLYPDWDKEFDAENWKPRMESTIQAADTTPEQYEKERKSLLTTERIFGVLMGNIKWIILATVPFLSLSSFLVFRRARYNYAEHLVVNSFFLAGALLISLIETVATWGIEKLSGSGGSFLEYALLAFLPFAYWQAHRARYSLGGWAWRVLALLGLFFLFILIATIVSYVIYKRSQAE